MLAVLAAHKGNAQTSPTAATISNSPIVAASAAGAGQRDVALSVPVGTPLQVALEHETRVKKVGQPLHGRLMLPVYAFDHEVIPQGVEVDGHISSIGSPGKKKLLMSYMNANFTPTRPVEVTFDAIVLPDGRRIPLHVTVVPGSGQVIRLVDTGKAAPAKSGIAAKLDQAKQEWQQARQQVHEPGKVHKAMRIAEGQLPVHPQYLDAGAVYYAELQQPLEFGDETVKGEELQSVGTIPPPGSLVRATLLTSLDSGTTKKGTLVQATLAKPLFDGDRLILPQGTRLNGSVLQVRPARRLKHNGQLRIAFHELVLPDGSNVSVDTTIQGIESGAGDNATLDSEGGAKATSSKSRYVSTGLSVSLAMVGSGGQNDVGLAGPAAGGAVSFKLIGLAVGLAVQSHNLAIVMSAYGGSMAIYRGFFGRGHEITFPKDTSMEIGFGAQTTAAPMSSSR
ncbi:MAG TPA: hypothetical protein VNW54_16020 [Granulicella sp.]|nr:hypothetical protein [Granulicella sp.]